MLRQMLQALSLAHGIAALLVAGAHFALWRRSGFWLPRYVHVLGLLGLLAGFGIVSTIPPEAPILRWGVAGQLFALLICPAFVYLTFIFFGGQAAALAHRQGNSAVRGPGGRS
jgi:hypothetical protein